MLIYVSSEPSTFTSVYIQRTRDTNVSLRGYNVQYQGGPHRNKCSVNEYNNVSNRNISR
jgi:hypothetical protein